MQVALAVTLVAAAAFVGGERFGLRVFQTAAAGAGAAGLLTAVHAYLAVDSGGEGTILALAAISATVAAMVARVTDFGPMGRTAAGT